MRKTPRGQFQPNAIDTFERDGRFPPMRHLLWQLERARAALAEGRLRAQRYGGQGRDRAPRNAQGPDRTKVWDET